MLSRSLLISGVSSGIGQGMARKYEAEGFQVLGIDINPLKPSDSGRFAFSQMDLVAPNAVANIVEFLENTIFQRQSLIGCISCAGVDLFEKFSDSTFGRASKCLEQNFFAAYHLNAAYVEFYKKNSLDRGRIINFSSVNSIVGSDNHAVYCGAKGAISSYSRALAIELARIGITVNVISPGCIDTPMFRNDAKTGYERDFGQLVTSYPVGRIGEVKDLFSSVDYLLDERSDFVTGVNLVVDGGMSAQ